MVPMVRHNINSLFFNEIPIPLPGSTSYRTMPSFALNEKVSTLIPEGTPILTDEGPSFPAVCNSLGSEQLLTESTSLNR